MGGVKGDAIGAAAAHNELLAALPPAERRLVAGQLEIVRCPAGMRLVAEGEPVGWTYFPTSCVAARFYTLPDGSASEHGVFGWDSLAGVSAVLGGGPSVGREDVVIEGDALRMPAEAVRAEFRRGGAFQQLLLQYTLALLGRISIEAACSAHHPVEQRLARLLLEVADRWSGLDLPLTQESLGSLLGVRRETACHAIAHLQSAGLIAHERGHITLIDTAQLSKAACGCYREVARYQPRRA
jgi:CRP-like cAMP-binding protein